MRETTPKLHGYLLDVSGQLIRDIPSRYGAQGLLLEGERWHATAGGHGHYAATVPFTNVVLRWRLIPKWEGAVRLRNLNVDIIREQLWAIGYMREYNVTSTIAPVK